jgi:iron complex outermembrane receptor protein
MMKVAGIFLLLIIFLPLKTAAQDESPELRGLTLEELMDTEVVSATQTAIPLQEAPSTIFVVTGDQIRRWGIRRLSELVDRLVPGAFAVEDGDDIIVAFRGISSDNNAKVLLLINGHYYNAQWNNGPNSEIELGFMHDIKRVEVINGPGGALYGSGATIGIINIITKSGKDFYGAEVSANYGSGDYRKGEVIAGGHTNNDADYFVSLGGLSADGYDNLDKEPLNISRFEPGYRFYGSVSVKNFELASRFTRSARALYNSLPSQAVMYTNYDTFFVYGRYSIFPSDALKIVADLSFDSLQTQRHDYRFGMKIRAVGEERYGFKTTAFYTGWDDHDLVLGAEYRRDEFGPDWTGDNFEITPRIEDGNVIGVPADPFTVRTITPYGRNVFGIFAQDMFSLTEKSSLLLGLRMDYIEAPGIEESFDLTPRIAFVHKQDSGRIFKAMYTSGFRQPIAVITSPDAFRFGEQTINQITDAEKVNSFELSGSTPTGNSGRLGLNLFYNILTNIHTVHPDSVVRPLVFVSTGRIDFFGFEVLADYYLSQDILLKVAHQYVHTGAVVRDDFAVHTVEEGDHIRAYPENVTKILVDLPITSRLSVNSNANIVWKSYGLLNTGELVESDPYFQWNANAIFQINQRSDFIVSLYNITGGDEEIPLTIRGFTKSAERNINFTLDYRF